MIFFLLFRSLFRAQFIRGEEHMHIPRLNVLLEFELHTLELCENFKLGHYSAAELAIRTNLIFLFPCFVE